MNYVRRTLSATLVVSLLASSAIAADVKADPKAESKPAAKADPKTAAKADPKAAAKVDPNTDFAAKMWAYASKQPYTGWKTASIAGVDIGPPVDKDAKSYGNATAVADLKKLAPGSVLVTEHYSTDKESKKTSLVGITVRHRVAAGYPVL